MTGGTPSFYKTPPSRSGQLARDFAALNPHLTLALSLFGEEHRWQATDVDWRKWTPGSPTCPHWYEPTDLERLIGAYITQDRRTGRERTVSDFVSEFRGLSGSAKCKHVLEAADLSRASLTALLIDDGRDFDHHRVGRLLAAMQEQTKPVAPQQLGVISREHIAGTLAGPPIRSRFSTSWSARSRMGCRR